MSKPHAIAHYRITSKIGAGGMGEVWLATDTKLNREVAIKILPEAFAHDTERMSRFTREAQVLASLNHPNIAILYGVEDQALVMEFVPGETLNEMLARGSMAPDEALPVARQIAEALEYAHEHGIVHRDLKPANVKITPEGRVKLLDFGLAKALSDNAFENIDTRDSPTLPLSATRAGVLLGTAAYMSPEQVRGHPADKRSDIWAFGTVLFELLTGRQAFAGTTTSDSLASVLKSDPDWSALPELTPTPIRRLLGRCLQRDRRNRLRDIGDALPEIDEAVSWHPETAGRQSPPARRRNTLAMWTIAGLLFLSLSLLGYLLLRWSGPGEEDRVAGRLIRFRVPLQSGYVLIPATHNASIAVSRNGRDVAYVAARGASGAGVASGINFEAQQLFYHSVEMADSVPIRGFVGSLKSPFFSPGGEWIGVFNEGVLKKIRVSGGPPEVICDVPSGHGATWSKRGLIVFASSHSSGLSSVSHLGGNIKRLTQPEIEKGESGHYWPSFLPDDKNVLFTVAQNVGLTFDKSHIEVLDVDSGQRRTVVEHGYGGRYVDSGNILYAYGGTLLSAPFDAKHLRVTGPAKAVLNGVRIDPLSPPDYDASPFGVLAYVPGEVFTPESRIVLFDRNGGRTELKDLKVTSVDEPSFSPDGDRIAFMEGGERTDIWTYDIRRGVVARITSDGKSRHPAWSPDGRRLAYVSRQPGKDSIMIRAADGHGEPESITTRSNEVFELDFRPDGKVIAFSEYDPQTLFDIFLVELTGEHGVQPLLHSRAYEAGGVFSPNGQWIAYMSSESGIQDIYVQAVNGPGKWRVSSGGGSWSVWSRDGRELFYYANGWINSVAISAGADPKPGPPRRVIQMPASLAYTNRLFDAAPDGRTFAVVQIASLPPASSAFEMLVNWKPH